MTEFENARNRNQSIKRLKYLLDAARDMEPPDISKELLHMPLGALMAFFTEGGDYDPVEKVMELSGKLLEFMDELTNGDTQLCGMVLADFLATLTGSEIQRLSKNARRDKI